MTSQLFSIAGKTILVTGASRGIGLALAKGLAEQGANLILAGRSADALQAAKLEMEGASGSIQTLVIDVSNVESIDSAFAQVEQIDVLINNAGVENVCSSLEVTEEIWDHIVDTNLKGAFFCAQAAAKKMVPNKHGAIINLCSLTSEVGVPGATPYGSSKSGMLGMTRALSTEWAKHGVRVNGIGPGYFQTEMTEVFYEDKDWCESMLNKIPLGRFGALDDLIGAAIYLASDASRYVTGQVLYVDGGYLASI